MTSRPSRAGFTLLETLVALAILGLALGSSFSVYGDSIGRARHAAMEAEAAGLAQALLDQLGTTLPTRKSPLTSGDPQLKNVSGLDLRFRWRIDFVPYSLKKQGDITPVTAALVTVQVAWHEGDHPWFVTIRTLRLGLKAGPA